MEEIEFFNEWFQVPGHGEMHVTMSLAVDYREREMKLNLSGTRPDESKDFDVVLKMPGIDPQIIDGAITVARIFGICVAGKTSVYVGEEFIKHWKVSEKENPDYSFPARVKDTLRRVGESNLVTKAKILSILLGCSVKTYTVGP